MGMSERVELLDGTFKVDAEPGAGTTLIVELPLP
jgi:signal transduction histidine kinase